MIGVEVNTRILERQRQALEAALSTNPETEKRLRKLVREVLLEARKRMTADARTAMKSDPRGTAESIRTSVYKAILGGNVNILNKRRAGKARNTYEAPRAGSTGRGGNRRPRGMRTDTILHYGPIDRGFILRFLNDGAGESGRQIEFTPNARRRVDKWNSHPNTGNRGRIAPRRWFGPSAERWVQQAADNLSRLIYAEVKKMME